MNPWLNSAINFVVIVGGCFALSLCTNPSYALPVQPHAGLILAGHVTSGAQPAINAAFLCVPFAYARFMAWQKGDTSACAGIHSFLSANPFLSCHPHLAVNGKASLTNGVSHD